MGDVALHTSPGSTKAFGDPLGEGLPASVRTPPSQQRIRAMPSPPPPSPHRCTRKSPRNPHSASPSVRRGAQGNPYPFLLNIRFSFLRATFTLFYRTFVFFRLGRRLFLRASFYNVGLRVSTLLLGQ